MRHFAITAVRVDGLGRISHAVVDQVEPGDAQRMTWWAGTPTEYDAREIAGLIAGGDIVETVFLENHAPVFGPRVKRVEYDEGEAGIELSSDVAGHTYRDLIQLAD